MISSSEKRRNGFLYQACSVSKTSQFQNSGLETEYSHRCSNNFPQSLQKISVEYFNLPKITLPTITNRNISVGKLWAGNTWVWFQQAQRIFCSPKGQNDFTAHPATFLISTVDFFPQKMKVTTPLSRRPRHGVCYVVLECCLSLCLSQTHNTFYFLFYLSKFAVHFEPLNISLKWF